MVNQIAEPPETGGRKAPRLFGAGGRQKRTLEAELGRFAQAQRRVRDRADLAGKGDLAE